MFPQKELVRVVKTKIKDENGDETGFEISLDLTGKKAGRGAYICRNENCYNMARKAKRFGRALSCEIPEEILEKMSQEIKGNE
jgi:predicted RNA-binding protein YlxR (DUF448 family)